MGKATIYRWGNGTAFPMASDVNSTDDYPVSSKSIKAYVDGKETTTKAYVDQKVAEPKTAIYFSANDKTYEVKVDENGALKCAEYTPPEPPVEEG